jgi:Ca2+-binding RTX toxin-like protein
MVTHASFSPGAGSLFVIGDSLDNSIVVSRDPAGTILINNGAVSVDGGQPTVGNTSVIQVFGQAGNDTISLNEANGALPAAELFGGAGNDTITGGSGNDLLFGQAGNDRMIWNPGDGSDLFEGGDGTDTAEVNGGNASEIFTLTPNGSRVRFDRVSPAPFSLDIGTTENFAAAMTSSPPETASHLSSTLRSTVATATTHLPAAPATIRCSVTPATTG